MKAKNTKTRAIAPKIKIESADFYTETFSSLNAGATFVLEMFPGIYMTTLARSIRGQFAPAELALMIRAARNTDSQTAGLAGSRMQLWTRESISLRVDCSEELEDITHFTAILNARTRFEIACLEIWAINFWCKWEGINTAEELREKIAEYSNFLLHL